MPQSYHDTGTFMRRIADEARLDGTSEASYAAAAAMAVLRRVSAGELEDMLAIMPRELRELLAETG